MSKTYLADVSRPDLSRRNRKIPISLKRFLHDELVSRDGSQSHQNLPEEVKINNDSRTLKC